MAPAVPREIVFPSGETLEIYFDSEKIPPPDISAMTRILANSFAAVPPCIRKFITELAVTPDMKGFMSARGRDNVLIFFKHEWIYKYDLSSDFMQQHYTCALFHECGHLLAQNLWGSLDIRQSYWKSWQQAVQSDGMYPSQYARTHLTDDMAEMLSLYLCFAGSSFEREIRELFPNNAHFRRFLSQVALSRQGLPHKRYDSLVLKANWDDASQWKMCSSDTQSKIVIHTPIWRKRAEN